MASGQVRNAALEGTNQIANAFGGSFQWGILDLQELRDSDPDHFRRLSFHARSLMPQCIAQLTWKPDRELIFHACILLQCNAMRNRTQLKA